MHIYYVTLTCLYFDNNKIPKLGKHKGKNNMNIIDKILITLLKRKINKSIKAEQKLILQSQNNVYGFTNKYGKNAINYYSKIDIINLNNEIINKNRIASFGTTIASNI